VAANFEGARRGDEAPLPGAPPPDVVHRVHDRYLVEVVEELGLCPFARRSREQGRVHRPLIYADAPSPEQAAKALRSLVAVYDDAEIVLLTFLGSRNDPPWPRARDLDDYVKQVRAHYDASDGPTFFMVGFHPRNAAMEPGETAPRLTADSLVPVLRRTPDAVIQCVRAEVLERVRAQAQQAAHAKLLADPSLDPRLRSLLEHSIQPDSTLSADIARRNFESVAHGEGRTRLDDRIDDIQRDRDRSYAAWYGDGDGDRDRDGDTSEDAAPDSSSAASRP